MPIRIACSNCREPLKVPDYAGGQVVQCPHCHALSEVPDVRPASRRTVDRNSPPMATPDSRRPLGQVAFVMGILGVITSCVPGLSVIFAFLALVLGAVGMTRDSERSAARTGMTLGIVAFVLMVVIVFAFSGLVMQILPWLRE